MQLIILSESGDDPKSVTELLTNADLDVNKARESDGATALYVASQNNHVNIVKKLLACPNIDVNKICQVSSFLLGPIKTYFYRVELILTFCK